MGFCRGWRHRARILPPGGCCCFGRGASEPRSAPLFTPLPQICFAPALREAGLRRQLFANGQALVREARGRGLVLSSGARAALELRGPLDVANLGSLLGLSQQQALAAITSAPAAVVARAAARRAYRGTLSVRVRSGEELTALKRREEAQRRQRQQQAGGQQAGQGPEGMEVDPPAAQQRPLKFAQMAGR
jgi:ribonuclease P/MRP protein subunit RPP1